MLAAAVRYYLDENIPVVIAQQLLRRNIKAVTVRDLDLLGDTDENHLQRAARMKYVLCTHDTDFIELAQAGIPHAGIVFGIARKHIIGDWVRGLELIFTVYTMDDMRNHIEYL